MNPSSIRVVAKSVTIRDPPVFFEFTNPFSQRHQGHVIRHKFKRFSQPVTRVHPLVAYVRRNTDDDESVES